MRRRLQPVALLRWLGGVPRWAIGIAIVALFLIDPLVGGQRVPGLAKLEAITYDTRLRLTQRPETDTQVVIIDIDEASLKRIGRWPWPRDTVARLTTTLLSRHGARAIGYDVLFPEPDTSGNLRTIDELARRALRDTEEARVAIKELRYEADHDWQFAEAMRHHPTVLAYSFTRQRQEIGALPPPAFTRADIGANAIPIVPEIGFIASFAQLQEAATTGGHIDPLFDPDGVVRRVPMIKAFGDGFYPSLSLSMAQVAVEAKSIRPRFDSNGDLQALDLGGLLVPVARDGGALVPFLGPQGTYRYYSAADVLSNDVPADAFTGALVLVGTTAKGLQDLRSTPLAPDFPGVEIHASLLSGMLNGDMRSIPAGAPELEALIMVLAGLVVVFVLPWRRPLLGVLLLGIVALVVCGVNFAIWTRMNAVVPVATTLVMLLTLLVWQLLTGFLREAHATRQLSEMFGEYVPHERVTQMRESGERFSMEGEAREMSVLFSDVRDFTALSERLSPRDLSAMLNSYLTPMTEAIHRTRGTIDKYVGDAIMAFWGAPVANPHHPRDAVLAALAMQAAMPKLRETFAKRHWPALSIGIGVNSGSMSVGDMGSRFRKAYTVLGDSVNLASRLEGLTKVYGVGILIGEATRAAVPEIECREIDRVRVKGREEPVTIYEPLGKAIDAATRARLERWNEALAAYRARRFDDAEAIFRELGADEHDAKLCAVFVERCEVLQRMPPPSDWNGATAFESK